jgi:hypothetical protein
LTTIIVVIILILLFIHLLKKEDAMSISALRSARCIFGVMAVTVFSALLLVGCSKDDDDDGGGDSLVCGAGEAWITMSLEFECERVDGGDYVCDTIEYGVGYIFQKNNDFLMVSSGDGRWLVGWKGKWSTSGSDLTLVGVCAGAEGSCSDSSFDATLPYTISGNKLTFVGMGGESESMTFTKSSGINPVYPEP